MIREACRTCGAMGLHDATGLCRQTRQINDEYECPGDGPWKEDEDGFFLYPTQAEMDEWSARIDQANAVEARQRDQQPSPDAGER